VLQDVTVFPTQGSHPEILRKHEEPMGFHPKFQQSLNKRLNEVLRDKRSARITESIIKKLFHPASKMSTMPSQLNEAACEGSIPPYNESPFLGALLTGNDGNHNNIDILQYESVGDET